VETGLPTKVNSVGSCGDMVNIETVFEPGLTATRFCFLSVEWKNRM
jgi:hypothetical protein